MRGREKEGRVPTIALLSKKREKIDMGSV